MFPGGEVFRHHHHFLKQITARGSATPGDWAVSTRIDQQFGVALQVRALQERFEEGDDVRFVSHN
jgi:hypothetical protein